VWDAIIAGAGPAGSVAAHVLARKGRKVLLMDGVPHGRFKVGESLPGSALRILRELGLPVPDAHGPHTQIGGNLSSWNSEELTATDFFHDPDGPGWRLDRIRFDTALRDAASVSGAVFKEARVSEVARQDKFWQVRLDTGEMMNAHWLIDATGRSAALARKLGATWMRDTPLTALYAVGKPQKEFRLNRTVVEAVEQGWWYAGLLPSGAPIAGFHLLSEHAAFFAASPAAWKQALFETRHLANSFLNVMFDFPLRALDASGGRLSQFWGNGWLACGDAALSFDPVSSQGILTALHNGMMAGLTVHATLSGDNTALDSYSSRLEEIRRIYLLRCRGIYRSETRWPISYFWLSCGRI
jgi:flavin-dependent dehydrogenase